MNDEIINYVTFTSIGFDKEVTETKDVLSIGYIGYLHGMPFNIHKTATPNEWELLQAAIISEEVMVIPYTEKIQPVLNIEQIRNAMPPLNRVQFVTVLRKHNLWTQAQSLADTLGIEAQVQFYEGQVFKRMDDTLIAVAGKLALSDDQVDALFNEAYQY